MPTEERLTVQVEDRTLSVSNLDKPLYRGGFTKGEVIAYYTHVAPALLPHLAGRPLTLRRWPNGTDAPGFFEKNVARTAPPWVRREVLATPGSTRDRDTIEFVVVEDLPSLVWVGNLAGLELHVPQWRVDGDGRPGDPDRLVVDLDPGAPADVLACARVAMALHERLAAGGLASYPKTSGSKGLQMYAGLEATASAGEVSGYAKHLAQVLEKEQPRLVVSRMDKSLRRGKVFVDWSQNNAAKTTIAPYSLRGRPEPTTSTPVTWDELAEAVDAGEPELLVFRADQTQERVQEYGDLLEPLLAEASVLPPGRA